jgi:Uma2 family endonuclease
MAVTELAPTQANEAKPLPGLTPEEFMHLYADEKFVELIRGEAVQLTPPGMEHAWLAGKIYAFLTAFVEENGLGLEGFVEAGFILEREPHTMRSPDVSFLPREKFKNAEDKSKYMLGAPDFAIEILSPTDSLRATESKARMYLRAGGGVVWILDPQGKTLRIYRPDAEPLVRERGDEADAEPVLPGFRCPVERLFPDI